MAIRSREVCVGEENIYFFGLSKSELDETVARGYHSRAIYESDERLKAIVSLICSGALSPDEPGAFAPLIAQILDRGDQYLVLADFDAYVAAQQKVDTDFMDEKKWARMSILNTALTSRFSSDTTIAAYDRDIWKTSNRPSPQ